MNIRVVVDLDPLQRLMYFINERDFIRELKDRGSPRPWTDDEILSTYRFCNVRRMDDKVSRWLLENWYEPYYDHPNMVVAVAFARFINLPATLRHVGFPTVWDPEEIKKKLRVLTKAGITIFNGAYMVRGNDGVDKVESVVDFNVNDLYDNPIKVNRDSMEETAAEIAGRYGYGSFMAGQIVADLRHAMEGQWLDYQDWAPVGPGSSRGLRRVLGGKGQEIKRLYKQEDFIKYLRELSSELRKGLPYNLTRRLEMHDYQNCLCEFDKYERVLWGEGEPKQKYTPAK